MADKGSGLGQFFSSASSGLGHALSGIGHDIGGMFSSSPSSGQASQAFTPSTGSIAAGIGPTETAPLSGFSVPKAAPSGISAHAFAPSINASGGFAPSPVAAPAPLPDFSQTAPSGTFADALKKYAAPAGLMFGSELLQQQQNRKALKPFQAQLAEQQHIAENARQLATAEQEGILPPAAQQTLQHNLDAARAAVQAKYASMGMTGSTAEAQDLQALNDQVIAQQFQLGQSMAQQGLTQAAQGDANTMNLLDYIAQTEASQGTDLGNIISQFASMFVPAQQVTGG